MTTLVAHQNREASAEHAVCVTVDTKFLQYGLFVLNQIADISPHRDFDLCIVTTDDLPDHPLIGELDIRICKLNKDVVGTDFPHSDRISMATYLRFYISRAMPDYGRFLYLDSDLIIRRGDFSALLRADIGPYPLAGARDPVQFRKPNRIPKDMKGLGLGPFRYLSAGVQLIDVARFNSEEIGEQAIALAAERPEKMLVYDQTAINAVLQGRFAELAPGWNWLYGFRTLYFTELYDPPILHFAGRRKPWNTLDGHFPVRYARLCRDFFQQHFPETAAQMDVIRPPMAARTAHLRYLLNHMNGLRRLAPAFDQFEHDLDIKL